MAGKNEIEMYSMHNVGKSVIAERFIRTLKSKIYKYITSVSKNMYINKLDDIVNKCNNTYHSMIKMKSIEVKSNIYFDSSKKKWIIKILNSKLVISLEYQNKKTFLQRVTFQNWSEEAFVIKKVKNTVPWTCVINDLNREVIVGTFYERI